MNVSASGFYEWFSIPASKHSLADARLTRSIRESFEFSDRIYGSPRVWHDLRAAGEQWYSRRFVGWSTSDTMQARMVSDELLMALWRRGRPTALMYHSEQDSQYTSDEFQQLLKSQNIICSMSCRGEC